MEKKLIEIPEEILKIKNSIVFNDYLDDYIENLDETYRLHGIQGNSAVVFVTRKD